MTSLIRRYLLWATVALSLLLSLTTHSEVVLELNTVGNPPLNTADGMGFMDRVAKESLRRIGIRLQIVTLPAERGLLEVHQGYVDGEMSRVGGLEKYYTNLVMVPEKIMDWDFVALSRTVESLPQGWASLSHHSVAIINGWKILEANIPKSAEVVKVKSPAQLFDLLGTGRVELIIFERWGGLQQLEERSLNDVHLIEPALVSREIFMYLNKRHAAYVAPLAEALRAMKQDGTYQRLYEETVMPQEKD